VNGFFCQCNEGFIGGLCDLKLDPCTPDPCLNGGACLVIEGSSFRCNCTENFQGDRCEIEKPSLIIVVTVTIVNREYNRAYEDIESPRSRALILELDVILIPFCRQRFPLFRRIRYKRFFFGSLGIEYDLEFDPSTNVTNTTVADEFVNANTTSDLQFLQFGRISAVEAEPTILPTGTLATPSTGKSESPEKTLQPWIIVVIASSVIVLSLLVVIIALAYKYRREKWTGTEDFISVWPMQEMPFNRANFTNATYANPGAYANGSGGYANGSGGYANGNGVKANGSHASKTNESDDHFVNEAYL